MDTVALILVIIGALNWGLVGIFQYDLIASIFGGMGTTVSRILYTLVGLAGIWSIKFLFHREHEEDRHREVKENWGDHRD